MHYEKRPKADAKFVAMVLLKFVELLFLLLFNIERNFSLA